MMRLSTGHTGTDTLPTQRSLTPANYDTTGTTYKFQSMEQQPSETTYATYKRAFMN
jgi:hypothetical protein